MSKNDKQKCLLPTHDSNHENGDIDLVVESESLPSSNVEPEDDFRNTELTGSRQAAQTDDEANFSFTTAGVSGISIDVNQEVPVLNRITVVGTRVVRRICLPTREEAYSLFKAYSQSLGSWYHVYHRQSVEAILNSTYHAIASDQKPVLSHVALLLSIFASGAYFQVSATFSGSVFSSPEQATEISLHWKWNTLDILNYIERASTPSSVEQLQATIITSLLIQNLEGLSKEYWLLHNTSISLARELFIHVLDRPGKSHGRRNLIEAEVKRRIWWLLATTDWLLGSMTGPQEGTYSINPQHAFVNRPMNVDDEDLVNDAEVMDKPLSIPTEMSYSIVRAMGGDMCRTFADMIHLLASGVNSVDYDRIVALEQGATTLRENLPFYFRLDEESRILTEPWLEKYPQLATQRYLLQQGLHCHRSRIHRPFLIRGSLNPRFELSRKACLESTRKSLEIRRMLGHEKRSELVAIARLNFVLSHVFMGALTLALDLCFNKSTTDSEDESRRAELKEACLMIQESRTALPTADRFLTPLMELLRKHKIQLQDAGPQNMYLTPSDSAGTPGLQGSCTETAVDVPDCSAGSHGSNSEAMSWNAVLMLDPNLVDFASLWKDFVNMSAPGWDDLLADMNGASLSMGV